VVRYTVNSYNNLINGGWTQKSENSYICGICIPCWPAIGQTLTVWKNIYNSWVYNLYRGESGENKSKDQCAHILGAFLKEPVIIGLVKAHGVVKRGAGFSAAHTFIYVCICIIAPRALLGSLVYSSIKKTPRGVIKAG